MEVKAKEEGQPPLLMISHGEHREKQTLYSVAENKYDTTSIPVLCESRVIASAYGWLVLVGRDVCCLWNPLSMDIIELPDLEMASLYNRCVLTKPPTQSGCHILFNSGCECDHAYCQIGDDEFVVSDEPHFRAIGSFQGKIYGIISNSYELVTIHFEGGKKTLLKDDDDGRPWCIPVITRPRVTWDIDHLIESSSTSSSELFLVRKMLVSYYLHDFVDFSVFRIDIKHKQCIEVDNIGQRTFFISHNGQGFCCSSGQTKPNCIYYMNRAGDSRNLYIYDLDDRSTTVVLPCPTVKRFRSVAFWVKHETLHTFINMS